MSLTGTCLCGAVSVTVVDTAPVIEMGLEVCCCTDCRQFTGCARGAEYVDTPTENVKINGEDKLKVYEKTTDAGNHFKRYFCSNCGSNVYGITSMFKGERVVVHSGLFKPGSLPPPGVYIWRSQAEKWDNPIAGVQAMNRQDPE